MFCGQLFFVMRRIHVPFLPVGGGRVRNEEGIMGVPGQVLLVGYPSYQGFGSGSGSGSAWIRINLSCWIRIQEGKNGPKKYKKRTEFSSFEVLDALF